MKTFGLRSSLFIAVVWALAGSSCSAARDLPLAEGLQSLGGAEAPRKGLATGVNAPGGRPCGENLIPNSDLSLDENRDGLPDLWVRGSSPSLIRDSDVGWEAVGEGEAGANALWITGGRDMAGEWAAPLAGLEPGGTYLLSFFLFREDFRNGWYPEVEVFGQRHTLNHHTSFRDWQRVELLLTAPQDLRGATWFRFLNRHPARFWLASPSLRPYRLSSVTAEATRSGVVLRWEETDSGQVLETAVRVTDARGETSRVSFLNVEAEEAWVRHQGKQGGQGAGAPPEHGTCSRHGLAWVPLKGAPPHRVELESLFDGRVIARASATLQRASSGGERKDLPDTPPRLQAAAALPGGFFPVGIYNVPADGLKKAAQAGFNTAHVCLPLAGARPGGTEGPSSQEQADIAAMQRGGKEQAVRAPLRYMLSALEGRQPYSRQEMQALSDRAGEYGIRGDRLLCLYSADEPELSGISPRHLYGVRQALGEVFPGAPSAVAMIRAWQLPYYRFAADWFLLDPYPVPNQPLTWMSDTLEAAGGLAGEGRALAVVQAFGGQQTAADGWDRYPTTEEMRVLAFLALVHGARGLFFYNYPSAAASEEQWNTVKRVVRDLNKVYPWVVRPASGRPPEPWVFTPEGWKHVPGSVHSAIFGGGDGASGAVLVVVNPASLPLDVRLEAPWGGEDRMVQELLRGRPVVLKHGSLVDSLPGQAVHVYADIAP